MIRIWLLIAGLLLGAAFPVAVHAEKPTAAESHDDASVKLTGRQVDGGKFAIVDVGGGMLSKHITVPGSITPSGDHIARVAVRLLGTVAELRKRLGDAVEAGRSCRSESKVARSPTPRASTSARDWCSTCSRLYSIAQHSFLRERFSAKTISFALARHSRMLASKSKRPAKSCLLLSLTAEQIEALPRQPAETLRRQELRAPIAAGSPNVASSWAHWSAAKARKVSSTLLSI